MQLIDQIRRDIVLGEMHDRERLPSLRTLAALYGVSIPTLRQATQALSYLGVIDIRPGNGTFVAFGPQSHRALIAGLKRASIAELAEMRMLIEVRAAELAAAAPEEEWHEDMLLWLIERSAEARHGSGQQFVTADAEFHRAVVAAGGSAYASGLHAQIIERLKRPLTSDIRRQARDEALSGLHRLLVDAIDERAPARAGEIAKEIAAAEAPQAR